MRKFKSLLPSQPRTVLIVGLRLTREQTESLASLCATLELHLHKQKTNITILTTIKDALLWLIDIQERNSWIRDHLSDLISRVNMSDALWLKELEDAMVSMVGKVKKRNDASRPLEMGWKQAAIIYWPLIAENHERILVLVTRLKTKLDDALLDEAPWSGDGKKDEHRTSLRFPAFGRSGGNDDGSSDTPRTSFDKRMVVRDIVSEEPVYLQTETDVPTSPRLQEPHTTALTNDRKRTIDKYRHVVSSRSAKELDAEATRQAGNATIPW